MSLTSAAVDCALYVCPRKRPRAQLSNKMGLCQLALLGGSHSPAMATEATVRPAMFTSSATRTRGQSSLHFTRVGSSARAGPTASVRARQHPKATAPARLVIVLSFMVRRLVL